MKPQTEGWLIVKAEDGSCEILPVTQVETQQRERITTWGPYVSQGEAIAKRVGLIRAGQCKPR
jgi:hypothetical protein